MTAVRWLAGLALTAAAVAQSPPNRLNPAVVKIVEALSEERIAASMKKLESFGTRYVLSEDAPDGGIAAAQRWLFEEFKSYRPEARGRLRHVRCEEGPAHPARRRAR